MANTININTNKTTDKYIKTFDVADDPLVFTLIRVSPYSLESMILGVFDSKESLLCRLTRVMDRPAADEEFKIEVHQLRNLTMEQNLD
ncbi:MAG: hypothetical protein CMA53_00345 [Euryarchaeota archaeon]|nr:hypothetical protein [Euryarchaeota archaeon]|tara:strand:- start:1200 stop:1463 length:264 start_codon:yes stop_codon:yes gene_type:complete